jgi:hypothetical protein
VPVPGNPTAQVSDWLPDGETTAWRFGKPAATLSDLGKLIAQDPDVATCIVDREWDYALSRGDIVRDLATVPVDVTAAQAKSFTTDFQFDVKKLIRSIYTSSDYVSR